MEIINMIYSLFKENHFYVDDISKSHILGMIEITIMDGDWKHDHGYCDYLMSTLGYKLWKTREIGESFDDSYSAVRYYIPNENYKDAELISKLFE